MVSRCKVGFFRVLRSLDYFGKILVLIMVHCPKILWIVLMKLYVGIMAMEVIRENSLDCG